MSRSTFPNDALRAFVAGESDISTAIRSFEALLESAAIAELDDEAKELVCNAALCVFAQNSDQIVVVESCVAELLKSDFAAAGQEPLEWASSCQLLHAYLARSLNLDLTIEKLLVKLRKELLREGVSKIRLPLTVALAQLCFYNEYLYGTDTEELQQLESMKYMLNSSGVRPEVVALMGMYSAPLSFLTVNQANRLAKTVHDAPLEQMITRLLREPLEERELALGIQTNGIKNAVTTSVRAQYEENPYPRWQGLPRGTAIQQPLHDGSLPCHPRILVAGCGTGRQPISIARRFPQAARIVALDLSVASLAYGQRQAKQFGCEQIEWIQGDLLEVSNLDAEFDLIFCSGVLHHLGDEVRQEGWNALADVLVADGLIRTHVYSAVSRLIVAGIRKEVANRNLRPRAEDMLSFRSQLIERLKAGNLGYSAIVRSADFYTMSGLRDLLFHIQEHQYRIVELVDDAAEAGLEFVNFELPRSLFQLYHEMHPGDPDQTNLKNWLRFEMHYAGTLRLLGSTWRKRPG